jgi:hypothetical protein
VFHIWVFCLLFKKSEGNHKTESSSSWTCNKEIIHEEYVDLGKALGQSGQHEVDNKIHVIKNGESVICDVFACMYH